MAHGSWCTCSLLSRRHTWLLLLLAFRWEVHIYLYAACCCLLSWPGSFTATEKMLVRQPVVMRNSAKLRNSIGLRALLLVWKGKSCKITLERLNKKQKTNTQKNQKQKQKAVLCELVLYQFLERCQRLLCVGEFYFGKRNENSTEQALGFLLNMCLPLYWTGF